MTGERIYILLKKISEPAAAGTNITTISYY